MIVMWIKINRSLLPVQYIEIMYKLLLFRIIFFNTSRKYYLTERHKNQHASLCNIIIIVERFCTYISCSFEYQKPDKKRCPRQYKKFMVHENNSLCRKMLRRTYTCLYPRILPFDNISLRRPSTVQK